MIPRIEARMLSWRSDLKRARKTYLLRAKAALDAGNADEARTWHTRATLYDGRQLTAKEIANSIYGLLGGKAFLPSRGSAEAITKTGQNIIMETRDIIHRRYQHSEGFPFDACVIYGDSVTGDSVLWLRDSLESPPYVERIDSLFSRYSHFARVNQASGKEYVRNGSRSKTPSNTCHVHRCNLPLVRADSGNYTHINTLLRHRTTKALLRVVTDAAFIDCTADHSLLDSRGHPVRPGALEAGYSRLFHVPPNALAETQRNVTRKNAIFWFPTSPRPDPSSKLAGLFIDVDVLPPSFFVGPNDATTTTTTFDVANPELVFVLGAFFACGEAISSASEIHWGIVRLSRDIAQRVVAACPWPVRLVCSASDEYGVALDVHEMGESQAIALVRTFVDAYWEHTSNARRVPSILFDTPKVSLTCVCAFLALAVGRPTCGKLATTGLFALAQRVDPSARLLLVSQHCEPEFEIVFGDTSRDRSLVRLVDIVSVPIVEKIVYDISTDTEHFALGPGDALVHNTDSVFVRLDEGPTPNDVTISMDKAGELFERMAREISDSFKVWVGGNARSEWLVFLCILVQRCRRHCTINVAPRHAHARHCNANRPCACRARTPDRATGRHC